MFVVAAMLTCLIGCKQPAANTEPEESFAATEAATDPAVVRQVPEGIQTVLVHCTSNCELSNNAAGFRNANRADFIQLVVIDEQDKVITLIQVNPDTMVSFKVPGKAEHLELPVGMVFTYGSGGSDSQLNMLNAASSFLGGFKIDHYLSFTMDAVAMVNDAVGGVVVPASDYFGDVQDDESILLSGAEAAAFFSARDDMDITNEARMERQQQYIKALYRPFAIHAQDDDFLTNLCLELGDNMATDLTLSQLILMYETFEAFTLENEFINLPGEAKQIDGVNQFYVDTVYVEELIKQLIFE